jgi:hypothetical protein
MIPEPGRFMPDRELAEMLKHHLPALQQERLWCGNMRAMPRIQTVIHELKTAIDLLESEHHR